MLADTKLSSKPKQALPFLLGTPKSLSEEISFVIKDLQRCFCSFFSWWFAHVVRYTTVVRDEFPNGGRSWNVLASASPPTLKSWPIKFFLTCWCDEYALPVPNLFHSLRKRTVDAIQTAKTMCYCHWFSHTHCFYSVVDAEGNFGWPQRGQVVLK